jgi:hypothetical protein
MLVKEEVFPSFPRQDLGPEMVLLVLSKHLPMQEGQPWVSKTPGTGVTP